MPPLPPAHPRRRAVQPAVFAPFADRSTTSGCWPPPLVRVGARRHAPAVHRADVRQEAGQGRPVAGVLGERVALQPQQLEGAVEAERASGGRLGDEVVPQVQLLQEGEVLKPLDALWGHGGRERKRDEEDV